MALLLHAQFFLFLFFSEYGCEQASLHVGVPYSCGTIIIIQTQLSDTSRM